MFKDMELIKQGEQLGDIINMLAAMTTGMREAFVRQQSRSFENIDTRYRDLNEEIAFDAAMADEQMRGKPLGEREPIFRYENILTQLQLVDRSLKLLADALKKQVGDGVLLTDKETEQIIMLLDRQENILRVLAEVVLTSDGERLKKVSDECSELAGACRNFATSYESRLVEGLCFPESAPVLLTILNRIQAVVHNEVETLRLLARWFWNHVAVGPGENAGHFSY